MSRLSSHRRGGRKPQGPKHQRRSPVAIAALVCVCLGLGLLGGAGLAPKSGKPGAPGTAGRSVQSVQSVSVSKVGSSDATTTTTAPGQSGTTTTTAPPQDPTVPAPAGYADQLTSLYGEIYTAATSVQVPDQSQQVMTPDAFQQQVAGLSQADLSMIYTATSNIPNFDSLSSTFQQADAVGAKAAGMLKLSSAGTQSTTGSGTAGRTATSGALRSNMLKSLGLGIILTTPKALTNYQPTSPVIIYPAASCPNGAPGIDYGETSIFALQVAVDVIAEAVAVIPDGLSTAFGNVTIPNIARLIVAAIQLGVVITHDTFAYLQAISNDCASNYLASLAGNTDNSAFQTFQELTQVAGTANEIDTNLANLTNQDTSQFNQQLTLAIEQALTAPTSMSPMAAMELPASLGGYLDSNPVGVNEVVSSTIQAMQKGNQPLSAQATRDETLAEQAFASGEYKIAFDYYRMSYQAAAG
ncbi:MAG: hypothetical protein ACRDZT_07965 [Acidimicrobiales bacterium]